MPRNRRVAGFFAFCQGTMFGYMFIRFPLLIGVMPKNSYSITKSVTQHFGPQSLGFRPPKMLLHDKLLSNFLGIIGNWSGV